MSKLSYITLLFLLTCSLNGMAQATISRQVFGAAGTTSAGSSIALSYNIGEPVVKTKQSSSYIITQGFEQPVYSLKASR